MKVFLGINYVLTVDKLPTIASCWECRQYIGKEGIGNAMTRTTFKDMPENLHFSNNTEADKSDKSWKVRPLISHFNESFSWCVSNDAIQNVGEHMVKFKRWSSMKQYIKNKPIKGGFKLWNCCASKTSYLYQFALYLGKKENAEEKLGEGVVLTLTECFENTCHTILLIVSSTALRLLKSFLRRVSMKLGLLENTGKASQKWLPPKQDGRWSWVFVFRKGALMLMVG